MRSLNVGLVNAIITTKRKIDNRTYFDFAPTRVTIDETIARTDKDRKTAKT